MQKQYPGNVVFLILRILELFTMKFVNFLKCRLIFILLILNVCEQTFYISYLCVSQNVF